MMNILTHIMGRAKTRLISFFERERSLNELSQLTDRDLNDIGITRSDLYFAIRNRK